MPDTEAKDVLSRGGAAFNAVRESILESSMRPEGKFLLDEITKQDIEITDLRCQLASALEAQQKAERERDEAESLLASATDLLNMCARENYAVQADRPTGIKFVIHNIWAVLSGFRTERDEARAEVQRLTQAAKYEADVATQAVAEVQRLSAENAELRKDRAFVDWQQSMAEQAGYKCVQLEDDGSVSWWVDESNAIDEPGIFAPTLREAFAAMKPPAQETPVTRFCQECGGLGKIDPDGHGFTACPGCGGSGKRRSGDAR